MQKKLLSEFYENQPYMGVHAAVHRIHNDTNRITAALVESESECREEIIWNAREALFNMAYSYAENRYDWNESEDVRVSTIDIDAEALKQPGSTYLWAHGLYQYDSGYEDDGLDPWGWNSTRVKRKKAPELNKERLIHLLDAIAGCACVLLNPYRYTGNWWKTTEQEADKVGKHESITWFGTDNFFMRHPVLMAVQLGLFRQVCLLECQNYGEAMAAQINRRQVTRALTYSDPKEALAVLEKLRPWIELQGKNMNRSSLVPFPSGYWGRFMELHKAIFRHGYDAVFDGNFDRSWAFPEPGKIYNRHDVNVTTGAFDYWGRKKPTKKGRLLAKLGK